MLERLKRLLRPSLTWREVRDPDRADAILSVADTSETTHFVGDEGDGTFTWVKCDRDGNPLSVQAYFKSREAAKAHAEEDHKT